MNKLNIIIEEIKKHSMIDDAKIIELDGNYYILAQLNEGMEPVVGIIGGPEEPKNPENPEDIEQQEDEPESRLDQKTKAKEDAQELTSEGPTEVDSEIEDSLLTIKSLQDRDPKVDERIRKDPYLISLMRDIISKEK
jgi:hypothetical protein